MLALSDPLVSSPVSKGAQALLLASTWNISVTSASCKRSLLATGFPRDSLALGPAEVIETCASQF